MDFNLFNFYLIVCVYLVSYNMFFFLAQSCSNFKIKKSNIHTLANDGKMTCYLKPEPGKTWPFKIFLSMILRFLSFLFSCLYLFS